jgi:hypothetical protein
MRYVKLLDHCDYYRFCLGVVLLHDGLPITLIDVVHYSCNG